MSSLPEQILTLLRPGVMGAGDLQVALGASPTSVRRALDDLGSERILRLGAGRATRYAARRVPRYCGASHWDLHEVDTAGEAHTFATLHALEGGQWYVEPHAGYSAHPMQVGSDRGVFDGLPWFLDIARPQGFLGRLFAQHAHHLAHVPLHLEDWTDDHVLASALMLGDDLMGNVLVGHARLRFDQARRNRPSSLPLDTDERLEHAMRAVLNGESVGSSAGGEQPKFTWVVQGADGAPYHRLVKFSPEMVTEGARRWGDLLLAEHLANQVLREAGVATANTRVREINHRRYLESDRFDREGTHGRRGLTALAPLAYTLGYGSTKWFEAAPVLEQARVLTSDQVAQVNFLHAFGRGIGNSDMHLGNLSLLGSVSQGWALAPVYDMTPMAYAPGKTMEVSTVMRELPMDTLPAEVVPWVHRFWTAVATHPDMAPGFQAIGRHHAEEIKATLAPSGSRPRRRP